MSDAPSVESRRVTSCICPGCGQSITLNVCLVCGWEGCDDHDFECIAAEPDVGLNGYLECNDCGLQIDDDGRFDQDFEDNVI